MMFVMYFKVVTQQLDAQQHLLSWLTAYAVSPVCPADHMY